MTLAIDWGSLGPLQIKAVQLADGLYAGRHRSSKRGGGIEFDGFREYSPGDDLRRLDRRARLQRDKLLVRQFETEVDRTVRLVVDATRSMQYAGKRALGSKFAYASLLGGALARLAIHGGDPVGLEILGGEAGSVTAVRTSGGLEAYRRTLASLEHVRIAGDTRREPRLMDATLENVARTTRKGAIVVTFSDTLDLGKESLMRIADCAQRGRTALLVQILDPDEVDFPFEGAFRFASLEGTLEVDSDQDARERYLAHLQAHQKMVRDVMIRRGARFLALRTDMDPARALRQIVEVLAHAH